MEYPMAITLSGYVAHREGPKSIGASQRIRNHYPDRDVVPMPGGHKPSTDAWRIKRFGPWRKVVGKSQWYQVDCGYERYRAKFTLDCGHILDREYRPRDGRFRCPECRDGAV